MNVIVVGCGRVGSELAYNLFKRGQKVVVLDRDPDAFKNLPADFRGRTLAGEVLSAHGVYTGGATNGAGKAATSILSRKNQIAELHAALAGLQEQVAESSRRKESSARCCMDLIAPTGLRNASDTSSLLHSSRYLRAMTFCWSGES